MKTVLSLALALALAFFATTPPAQASRGIAITDTSGQPLTEYAGSYALVVGVSRYDDNGVWCNLGSVPAEIDSVVKALERHGFQVTRVLNPTGEKLEEAFDDFIDEYGYDKRNRLLFFYSGHGYTLDTGTRGFLVPVDAPDPRRGEKSEAEFRSKALPMLSIRAMCQMMTANHALFLFDSCFSGTIFSSKGANGAPPPGISYKTAQKVRQFITAGDETERVPTMSDFTPAFVEALDTNVADLNEDGYLTGSELGMYLQDEVSKYGRQHPQWGKINIRELAMGDFVFKLDQDKISDPQALNTAPSQSGGVDYSDLEAKAEERAKWEGWQQSMIRDFATAEAMEANPHLTRDEKIQAWEMALSEYGRDNPFSTKDQDLRARARDRIAALKTGGCAPGGLRVRTPPGTEVRFVGRDLEYGHDMKLEPGTYELEFSKPGHKTVRKTVVVECGETHTVSASPPLASRPVHTWTEPHTGMKFVLVPEGRFTMGQSVPEKDWLMEHAGPREYNLKYSKELPRREVRVNSFWMGETEVTVGQFWTFVRETGYKTDAERRGRSKVKNKNTGWKWTQAKGVDWIESGLKQNRQHPVVHVSWQDARAFADWLSGKYRGRYIFSLPSEAQWEYAARGGTDEKWFWGEDQSKACLYANVADQGHGWKIPFSCDDQHDYPAPAGSYRANPFGLKDMIGNVWEWCLDKDHPGYGEAPATDAPWMSGTAKKRVARGGSWTNGPHSARSACRAAEAPSYTSGNLGFRLVRTR